MLPIPNRDFKRTFTMGPVEEIHVPFGDENDVNVSEAANANFDHDRESNPIESNPNFTNNCVFDCLYRVIILHIVLK